MCLIMVNLTSLKIIQIRKTQIEIWNGIEINRVFTIARKNKKLRIALNYLFVLSGIYFVLFRLKDKFDVISHLCRHLFFKGSLALL